MKTIRIVWRLIFFLVFTTRIVGEIWLKNVFLGENIQRSMRIRRYWAQWLLKGVGMRITVEGQPPEYPCLLVGNHRSYVDPIIILGQVDAWPVAKAEVADWPVLGHGAQMAGILYVRREDSRNRAMILSKIGSTIEKGFTVILFPEGTTSDLDGTLPFRKGGFLMAAKNGVPVVPFALCFQDPDDYWVRDESFLTHAARRFRQKNINIKVIYGLPITHDDPDYLMDTARAWINDQLHREVPASGLPA